MRPVIPILFLLSVVLSLSCDQDTPARKLADQSAFRRIERICRASLILPATERDRSRLLVHRLANGTGSNLDRFFTLLSDPDRKGPVRILHYGDSLLWADLMTSRIRTRLTNVFGNGGRGLIAPALEAQDNALSALGHQQWGNWSVEFLQTMAGFRQEMGITMRRVTAVGIQSFALFDLSGDAPVDSLLVLAEPGSGSYILTGYDSTGTRSWSNANTITSNAPVRHVAPFPMSTITLSASPGTILYGISLERQAGGLVYTPVMRRGICSHDLPDIAAQRFRAQLAEFGPDLVILQFGKNEAGWDKYTLHKHLSGIHWMVSNLKAACPSATLLLFGPGPRINTWASPPRVFPSVGEMNTAQRELALAGKAVWFDSYTALGKEEGFMAMAWQGLVMPDYVHLTYQGGDFLGDIFADALLEAYGQWILEKVSSLK